MCLIDFIQTYNSEEKCQQLFKEIRDQEGVVCKRCGSLDHYWLSTRLRYRCKTCKWETTLRSGTALYYSKMPIKHWIYAIAFLAFAKKPTSSRELRGHIGHKHYRPIWAISQKLRITMGHRVAHYMLKDFVKTGNTEFPVSTEPVKLRKGGKWVLSQHGMAEVSVYQQTTYAKQAPTSSKRVKHKFVRMERQFSSGKEMCFSTIRYVREQMQGKSFEQTGVQHHPELWRSEFALNKLLNESDETRRRDWTKLMTINASRNFHGIYHNISERYFNNYLYEYCYITNRRFMAEDKLKHLLILVVSKPWYLPFVQASDHSEKHVRHGVENTAFGQSSPPSI